MLVYNNIVNLTVFYYLLLINSIKYRLYIHSSMSAF